MKKAETILYKYISLKHAEEIIKNQRLRMSDGSDFNDPFELIQIDGKEEERIKGLHILCLTNSQQNKLMWSHYSDNHKGICLAVKVPAEDVYAVAYTGTRAHKGKDVIIDSKKIHCKKNLIKDYSKLSLDNQDQRRVHRLHPAEVCPGK